MSLSRRVFIGTTGLVTVGGTGLVLSGCGSARHSSSNGSGGTTSTGGGSGSGGTTPPANFRDTQFLSKQRRTYQSRGSWTTDGFTVNQQTTFVFRVAADYSVQAAIITDSSLSAFTNNQAFSGYAIFDNTYGTKSVTLNPGTYYVAVRNTANAANTVSWEFDYNQSATGATYDTNMFSRTDSVAAGGWYYQPFTINAGYSYVIDGCNSGMNSYIIPESELNNFKSNATFRYYTNYADLLGGEGPGRWVVVLPTGNYGVALRNSVGIPKTLTMTMDRWKNNNRSEYGVPDNIVGEPLRSHSAPADGKLPNPDLDTDGNKLLGVEAILGAIPKESLTSTGTSRG
jgi:hypothetical protein